MKSTALNAGILRAREVRCQPYWETRQLAAAAVADHTYFGAVPATAGGHPVIAAPHPGGNMQSAGQLPAPRQFLIKGLSIYVETTAVATAQVDALIIMNGVYILTISDKEYLRVLGWMAPGGGGLELYGAVTTLGGGRNGQALTYNYFHVAPSILIPQQQNFKVVGSAFGLVALTTVAWVTCVLWGTEERAVQ